MNPPAPPLWLAITALIGFATLVVAAMQWVVARNKVRLELFDKRYAIYAAVKKLLQEVVRSGDSTTAQISEYWQQVVDADFLFGPEVGAYLDKVGRNAAAVHAHKMTSEGLEGDGRVAAIDRHSALIVEMADDLLKGRASRVFAPYLGFSGMRALSTFSLKFLFANKRRNTVTDNAASDDMRRVRAEIFASVFDRMMWLITAILAVVLASIQQGLLLAAPAGLHLKRGVILLFASLALTILVPPYRALMNAVHAHRGKYRIVWESYIAQVVVALMTAAGIGFLAAGFIGLLLPP